MRRLTKAGTPFSFAREQREAFEELKSRLSSAETLGYFDEDASTQEAADASQVGLGAVLTQLHKDDRELSVTLAVVRQKQSGRTRRQRRRWACENFHPYIYGTPFELVTHHKPLEVIYGPQIKTMRPHRKMVPKNATLQA